MKSQVPLTNPPNPLFTVCGFASKELEKFSIDKEK